MLRALHLARARTGGAARASPARALRRSEHSHSHNHGVRDGDTPDVTIHWVFRKTGETASVGAYYGENLMRLAQRHDIPLEGARAASRAAARSARPGPLPPRPPQARARA